MFLKEMILEDGIVSSLPLIEVRGPSPPASRDSNRLARLVVCKAYATFDSLSLNLIPSRSGRMCR